MKYFLDTEFIEGPQSKRILGIKVGKTKPTIDLISVGIVAEDEREYYAISKDFNLWEAWNRFDLKHEQVSGDNRNIFPNGITRKVYWIRDNVLKPIFEELVLKQAMLEEKANRISMTTGYNPPIKFTYNNLKKLISLFGKTNKQISSDVVNFVNPYLMFPVESYNNSELKPGGRLDDHFNKHSVDSDGRIYFAKPEFYTYYGDYDWVVFCWLFGKMIDLPKGFPMYSRDLKQIWDEFEDSNKIVKLSDGEYHSTNVKHCSKDYPKQYNKHNALSDARWNFELYKFLQQIK